MMASYAVSKAHELDVQFIRHGEKAVVAMRKVMGVVGAAGVVAVVVACGGNDSGATGVDSGPAIITTASEVEPGDDCEAGGTLLRTGPDANGNGKVDGDEATDTFNICYQVGAPGEDGAKGADGTNGDDGTDASPVLSRSVPAGTGECPQGGSILSFGVDDDGDDVLSDDEVDSTIPVCHGATGSKGADACAPVIALTTLGPGPECPHGGIRIAHGDDDGGFDGMGGSSGAASMATCNGILDEGEEDGSEVVCHGLALDEFDLIPTTGSFVNGTLDDRVYWSNKGYNFTAAETFTIAGAEWFFTLPAGGIARVNIYDSGGSLLAQGTDAYGSDDERWYRSKVAFTFQEGQTYTVGFYTDRAASAPMDRMHSPTQPFGVSPLLTNVRSVSGGTSTDDGTEVFPNATNSWAPFQRLLVVP